MAQGGVQLKGDTTSCSICLDLMVDPVTIPCGHSYCMSCITVFWDFEGEAIGHSCPQCRRTFTQRPVLIKNTMLADLMEELKKTGPRDAPADLMLLKDKLFNGRIHLAEKRSTDDGKQEIRSQGRVNAKPRQLSHREDYNPYLHHYLSLSQPEPTTRHEFLQYSQEITLDPKTANTRLLLSEGNRKVTAQREERLRASNGDRFTSWPQVLSRERLTGRCYWEVEKSGVVNVAVAYEDISRAGDSPQSRFGSNDKSWTLDCYRDRYRFYFNNIKLRAQGPPSSRVGVYLDHGAGILSYYSVSDSMTLLHRVQTTFTQPLCAGVCLYDVGFTAEFCKLKKTRVI